MQPVLSPEVIITRSPGVVDDRSVITLNDHALEQPCAVRVVGGAGDITGSKHEWLSMHMAMKEECEFKEPAHHEWLLTKARSGTQLVDARGILNVFEFVPLTGIVAVQLALTWGAIRCILRDMPMDYEEDVRGPHDIQQNRAFMQKLQDEGIVEHWK